MQVRVLFVCCYMFQPFIHFKLILTVKTCVKVLDSFLSVESVTGYKYTYISLHCIHTYVCTYIANGKYPKCENNLLS